MRNTHWAMAVFTPMSRTRAAREPKASISSAGRPKSLTKVAPGAEKRSVICVVMAALWLLASRSMSASLLPMRRAGMRNIGSITRASRVIDHDSRSITARVSSRVIMLLTNPDRVQVKARWAPITSLSSRLTRAPVRVRVKNATGMRWTWPKTARRRSRIRPSPMRDEYHRATMPTTASSTATRAMSRARPMIVLSASPLTMASMTRPASSGVATLSTAAMTLSSRNQPSARLWGRAKLHTRLRTALVNVFLGASPCMAL